MSVPDVTDLGPGGPAEEAARFEQSELGNAKRLVAAHGDDLRHVPEWRRWLTWDGRRWAVDLTGEAQRRAKLIAEAILDQARIEAKQDLFRWGIKTQSAAGVNNMLALAATEPGVPVLVDELDADPWSLTVDNGVLDLRTGNLRPHEREDLTTKIAGTWWDPEATCPTFERFLEEIIPDDDVRRFVQRAVGYALSGDVSEQVLFVFHGGGSNGKSTLLDLLMRLLGDHAAPAAPKLLVVDKHSDHPTAIADLHGRRLVVAQEVDEGQRLDESLVKMLTGGDRLKARLMRQDFWSFAPTAKLVLACNHKPRIRGTDHGIWRRIRLVPFEVSIPADRQDKALPAKLAGELPGVLRWAMQGCLDWQRHGLDAPKAVTDATDRYRVENDLLAQYVCERCLTGLGYRVRSADLYADYIAWCAANGLDHPLSHKALSKALSERGFDRTENRAGQSVWLELALLATVNESTRETL